MSGSRQRYDRSSFKTTLYLARAFVVLILAADIGYGQSNPSQFRAGQSMYIVAFRLFHYPLILDEADGSRQRDLE